jgi:hypothetical protein
VNSGVSLAFHRYSFSSQGENSEFDIQGVSPGAPKDLETGTRQSTKLFTLLRAKKQTFKSKKKKKKLLLLLTGPDLPGVSDCDSETDQDESSSSSAFVIPVQFNVHQLPTVSVDVESTASTIRIQDNSIKLVVPSGFASPNSAGESSDGKPDGN